MSQHRKSVVATLQDMEKKGVVATSGEDPDMPPEMLEKVVFIASLFSVKNNSNSKQACFEEWREFTVESKELRKGDADPGNGCFGPGTCGEMNPIQIFSLSLGIPTLLRFCSTRSNQVDALAARLGTVTAEADAVRFSCTA